jgi:cytochrome P450
MSNNSTEKTTQARSDPEAERMYYELMLSSPDNPYPGYHRLRSTAPALITSEGMLVLTQFADCDAALRHRSFGKGDEFLRLQVNPIPEDKLRQVLERMQRNMILANPPDHTRLRRIVSSAFTVRHIEALRETITRRVEQLLADLAANPGADFMQTFALPLPLNVIADVLGVPVSDRADLAPNLNDMGLLIEPAAGPEEILRGVDAEARLASYFADLLADKRAKPADDLLSRLVASREQDALDETEMISTALLLFAAGNKTSALFLGNALHAMLTHPDEFQRIRNDPDLIAMAVEELLRYDSSTHLDARAVLEPTTFLGADLQPGQTIITVLGAANRDPDRFHEPDILDIMRQETGHLSFASGIHLCLGAHLIRLEARIFFARLIESYPQITLSDTPKYSPGLNLHGIERLPVTMNGR